MRLLFSMLFCIISVDATARAFVNLACRLFRFDQIPGAEIEFEQAFVVVLPRRTRLLFGFSGRI